MSDVPDEPAAAPAAPPAGEAARAGRGGMLLAGGNVLFILAGMILQFGLPALLTRSAFGAYTTISSIASWINNVMITGTINMVSKFTAAEPDKARQVQRAGLRMNVVLALVIAVGFVAAAPVAAWLLHDASKISAIMLAGVIAALYGVYAVFVGTANGLHQFGKQAALSSLFAYVRIALMLAMAAAGFGVIGVVAGWVAAVVFILLLAIVWVGMPGRDGPVAAMPVQPLLRFFAGVAVFLVLFNLLMFVDTFLLKRVMSEYSADHAAELGPAFARLLPWPARDLGVKFDENVFADVHVGYYAAVQNLARLSYQVTLATSFVVFPLVSRSTFEKDPDVTRRYVGNAIRYTLIAAAAIAVVMAANPVDVLGLVYAPDFAERGGAALPFLALGNVAFSLIGVAAAIFNGAGEVRKAVGCAAATLVIAIAGNAIALPMAAGGDSVLLTAAAVTGGAMLAGALIYGAVLYRRFGAFVPALSVVRVAAATAAAMAVGHVLPLHGKVMTLVESVVVVGVFVVVLVATRELGARDLDAIKAIRKKRATQGEAT